MAKNNIRSVRFSDEMIEIINQQIGDNFTQKFERMVYNCYMLLPEKERQAREWDDRISRSKEKYYALSKRYSEACAFMISLENQLKRLERTFSESDAQM